MRLTLAAENGVELLDADGTSVGVASLASSTTPKQLTIQRTKVLSAACKIAALITARATNSIRFGDVGGAVEACNVLRQCVHWATADGT